jgi:hypothetical protein
MGRAAALCPEMKRVVIVPCMDDARVARGIWHFSEAFGCSHVFGLRLQPFWLLALM